jgi:hypothetical protein
MSRFFAFIQLYETRIFIGLSQKVIIDPLKIELLPTMPRSYTVGMVESHTFATDINDVIGRSVPLTLDRSGRYILLTARTEESQPMNARRICEDAIDRGTGLLTAILGPAIFGRQVFRGWVENERGMIAEAWVKRVDAVSLPVESLSDDCLSAVKNLKNDPDLWRRFTLISRFWSRSLGEASSEEKYLFLWTVLEIFPMKDTTNIRPISELLSAVVRRPADFVKEKLEIGRLFGLRSELVHNGTLGVDELALGRLIDRLENICREATRALAGLEYTGSLEQYF